MARLKAQWPAFGGKSKVSDLVWERLGDPDNFVEPCAQSAAILLGRPEYQVEEMGHKKETINDLDHYVANYWRSVKHDPDAVAHHANWPASEADMHARHRYLLGVDTDATCGLSESAAQFRSHMVSDPEYWDAKRAGWWVWGMCLWIGGGWCDAADAGTTRRIKLGRGGSGVRADAGDPGTAHRMQLADAYSRGRGVHAFDEATTDADREAWLRGWCRKLSDRLRAVRVCCGDWERVCGSPSVTTRLGLTSIFFDPPYAKNLGRLNQWIRHLDHGDGMPTEKVASNRSGKLYATDGDDVDKLVGRIHVYCREWGTKKNVRIALCGLDGEHNALESRGWEVVAWKSSGYGNRTAKGKVNGARERIWFSPECLPQLTEPLFDAYGVGVQGQ